MEKILLNIFKENGIVKIILDMKKQMENNEKKRYFIQYIYSDGYYTDDYNACEMKSKLLNLKQLNYLIQKCKNQRFNDCYGLTIIDVNGVIIFECDNPICCGASEKFDELSDSE